MTDSRPLLEVEEHPPPPPSAAVADAGAAASGGTPTAAEGAVAQAADPPTPTPSPRLRMGHYLILVSLNSIGAFSSDCYIPNLSDVVDDLDATDQQVSLTIQINWVLLGLATPVVGHLSDMYGRKRIVCFTLLVYVAGALGSAFAPTIGWLLGARCVQGVGEAASIVTSAIIRDTIDEPRERMRVQALFTTLRPLMLLGGPSIGGAVGAAFGWRNLMRALSVWGALTIPLVLLLPESLPPPADRPKRRAQCSPVCSPLALLCPGLECTKLKRMAVRAD